MGGSETIDECQIVTEDEKILIVDDNRKSADTLKQNLEGIGFVADVESDPVRAEDRICHGSVSGRPYSYVFIDYEMPNQNGLTLLRSLTKLVGIKKVFMADLSQLLAIREARTLGAELFLAKPYKLREILDLFNTPAASEPEQQSSLHEQIDTIKSTGLIERAARPRRILLAEDNAVNQKLIQRTLERKNFVVTIVNNGKEAVEMYKSASFDLILMDVQMPVMDGLSATRIIRDYEKTLNKRTPIVAMTAHAFQETQNECLEAGMDYYFSKPISGTSLTEKIDTILRP
jgi:CheY-like chemotaxis protein